MQNCCRIKGVEGIKKEDTMKTESSGLDMEIEAEVHPEVYADRNTGIFRFIFFSLLGLFIMFVDVKIGDTSTIIIQHIINLIKATFGPVIPYYALVMVLMGGIIPLVTGVWKKSKFDFGFTVIKVIGGVIGIMAVFEVGPAVLLDPNMIPFLYNLIVIPIALMIPVTLISLVLILNYGVLEFLSIFLQPVMRKIWKTPGESALDAMISFTGGYAIAVLVTNNLYKKGVYTAKESVIIATGFSTVSVTFLVVIANTLNLMEYWTAYFFSCFAITFLVTAITARIYPISKVPNDYYENKHVEHIDFSGNIFTRAFNAGVEAARKSKSLGKNIIDYYKGDAIKMSAAVTASILTIGLAGLLLSEYTPIFDMVAYIFYPFTYLLKMPEPMLAAKAAGVEIAEMFIPALLVVKSDIITKFVTGVVSVSAILFFSASIPCLLSTDIPVKLKDIIIIWIERTILSLVFAVIVANILF